ncbi:MAG: hypothetical protein M5R36_18330 [Deltaproteobacteria bacterium]|nr:hypothetical protein [Deltaproteobacteria bacterium]
MDNGAFLIIRRKTLGKLEHEQIVRDLLHAAEGLDPYITRLAVSGDGLALIAQGDPRTLRAAGDVLSRLDFEWTITPKHIGRIRPERVLRFTLRDDRIDFEGPGDLMRPLGKKTACSPCLRRLKAPS